MDVNYCSECGNKIGRNSNFCDKCGFKINEESKTKFCSNCGEKIDFNAEICPHCGVRIMIPIASSANEALNRGVKKADDFLTKYVTARNVLIVFLVIIVLALIVLSPAIIDALTPYKQIDSSYIANPVPGEKVQFDGEYIGHTGWGGGIYYFYVPITDNDVVKVGDQYVIIQGDYLSHDLYGHEGSKVHLEGRFAQTGKSKEPVGDEYIYGYWFGADTIELI